MPSNESCEYTSKGKRLNFNIFGRGLVMASLNINSLLSHIDDLKIFISSSKIDILAINETKLDSSIHDYEIHLPGFEVVRRDRLVNGRNGGGVCIYLRNTINYRIRDDLCDDQLECLIIEITRPHSRPFLMSTWYRPPSSPIDIFYPFEKLVDKIDSEHKDFYLLGDLNCNMLHEQSINHNSLMLTNIFDIYGLSQLISEPTRVTPNSRTLIDLCITNSPEKIIQSGVLHLALRRIRPFVSQSTGIQIYNALIQPYFDYCSPVWDGLSNQLSEKLQKLQNRAARVILKANYETSPSMLLEILNWDTLSIRRKKLKALIMFKSLNKLAPVYLQDLFIERSTEYNLRNSFNKLSLPKPRTNYLKRSFSYSGAQLWNSLPENIRKIKSTGQFKREIHHVFDSSASHSAIL